MVLRPRLVAIIIACASFMQNLDATIITTALPDIAQSFNTSPVQLSVAITSYILSLAVFIPISGWMADRFGASLVFRIAIGVFILGSALCGLSNNTIELTAARIVQGVGGAMMNPVGRLVVLRSVPKSQIITALTFLQIPAQVGPLLGPPVGGFITTYFSWRWIFLINVPIGIIGIIMATLFIPNYSEGERRRLDWAGFVLTGGALSFLMYGLEASSRGTVSGETLLALFGVGITVGLIAVWHAKRHPEPLLDLNLLRIPSFRLNLTGGSLYRIGVDGLPFLLPLLFQVTLGMTAFSSGLLTFASAAGAIVMRLSIRPILRRIGFRLTLLLNGIISAASLLSCALFTKSTPATVVLGMLLVGGFFRSLQFNGMSTLAYADVPPQKMSTATSMSSVGQQLCNGFGIATAALILNSLLAWRGSTQLIEGDFQITFFVEAAIALLSLVFVYSLPRDAGTELSGHRPKPVPAVTEGE